MVKQKQNHLLQHGRERESRLVDVEHGGAVRWSYIWGVLVALISILITAILGITYFSSFDSSSSAGSVVYKSERVKLRTLPSPRSLFARDAAKDGVPIVLRNSITKTWRASKKWSPSYLKSKLKGISGVYENTNRWFGPYFDRSKPLLETAVRQNSYKTGVNMSANDFFNLLQHPRKGKYHYFTGSIDDLGKWAYSEVQPLDELLYLNPKLSSVNVWIGQPHVIAHCHYDGYHNFYAQLYGTKKFMLFAPSNWPGLYPYPFLHPSHAQAQVNASDKRSTEAFPLIKKVKALEVVLEPGDLLYMPPLWFHEVESQSISISVNVWTDSSQTDLMMRIFSVPLPFERLENPHGHKHAKWESRLELRMGTSLVILRVLEKICSYRKCVDSQSDHFYNGMSEVVKSRTLSGSAYFVFQLWDTRYRALMEKSELPSEAPDGSTMLCEKGSEEEKKLVKRVNSEIDEDVHYGAYVEQVSLLARSLPEQTWSLWMGNYVESVVYKVLEDPKYVGFYLQHFNSCPLILQL